MNIHHDFWVRVLLYNNDNSFSLKVSSSFVVLDNKEQSILAQFSQTDNPLIIKLYSGQITIAGLHFSNDQLIILPDKPHIFNLNDNDYRGKLKLIAHPDSNSIDAINLIPISSYLAGVVGAEMPHYWEPQALKAQSIAARTYCLYVKKRFGSNRDWDVTRTAANQVYLGIKAEYAQVWQAVNQTEGRILACKVNNEVMKDYQPTYSISNGQYELFPAYYSSICGGHTENSRNVFGDSFTPLLGRPCPYCKDVAKPRYFLWPMAKFDKAEVTEKLCQKYPNLKELGKITDIVVTRKSDYNNFSRLTLIKLVGSTNKSDSIRAEDLRLTIDPTGNILRSAICQIADAGDKWVFTSGRGWGHGVGMCQCGAQAMARQGKTAEQILDYYYPGSEIIKIY